MSQPPFRAVVARTSFESPSLLVHNTHGEELTVDLTQNEHGAVVVNVRPGEGMAASVDVEFHTPQGSQLLT